MSVDRSSPVNVAPSGTTPIDDATMADGSKRQLVAIGSGDSASGANVADVLSSEPGVSTFGLVTRPHPFPEFITAITLTTSTLSQAVTVNGRTSFAVELTSLGTGGQIVVEGSVSGGTWIAFDMWDEGNEKWLTGAISATGSYWVEAVGAITQIRVRAAALTSGTITGNLLCSFQPAFHNENLSAPNGVMPPVVAAVGGSDGINLRAIATTSTGILKNAPTPQTSGGLSTNTFQFTSGTSVGSLKTTAGQVYGYHIFNTNTTPVYVMFYNVLNTGVTPGTTSPLFWLGIPAGGGATISLEMGLAFSTAISISASSTANGNTSAATAIHVTVFFI